METFLNIPEKCRFDVPKHIDPAQIFRNGETPCAVNNIEWLGKISPISANVSEYRDERNVYEEIQIFFVDLAQPDDLYHTVSVIFRTIRYHCLLIMRYSNKYLLSACAFEIGKLDPDQNVLRRPALSHWIHNDYLSPDAEKFMAKMNSYLSAEGSLKEIYLNLLHEIQMFPLGGIHSKQYVINIVRWLRGGCSDGFLARAFSTCTPYKKYAPRDNSIRAQYEKRPHSQNYTYSYDAEDVWYSLIMEPSTERVIRARKYRNLEEIMYRMDG